MSRQPRIEIENVSTVYHVTACGWERRVIVRDDRDRETWSTPLDRIVVRFEWRIFAWVPMDNHFHPFVQTPKANLSAGRPACTTWTRTTPRGSIDDIDVLGHSRDDSRRFWSLLPRGQTTSWSHLGFRKDQRLLSYKSRPDPMSVPTPCRFASDAQQPDFTKHYARRSTDARADPNPHRPDPRQGHGSKRATDQRPHPDL